MSSRNLRSKSRPSCGRWLLLLCFALASLRAADTQVNVRAISDAIRSGRFQEAVESAEAALQSNPRDVRLATLRAIALSKLDKSAEALAGYRQALAIDPHYVPALAGISELEYPAATAAATRDVDALLALRPGDETAHAMRAYIAWKHGDCAVAVEHFSQSQQAIAQQPSALKEFSYCLEKMGNTPQAVSTLREAIVVSPD
ncbi:MAG: tetratricopeptide repeat protein, partial [Bryobacteraceae bacterium]